MSYISNKILNLAKQLLPNGLVWRIPTQAGGEDVYISADSQNYINDNSENYIALSAVLESGDFERLLLSTGGAGDNQTGTAERAYNDTTAILHSIIADNDEFTDGIINPLDNDCDDWERRLGLVRYGTTTINTPTRAQRIGAINTKYVYPGTAAPRQSSAYLEAQLRSAGFNVRVYENLNGQTPATILGISIGQAYYGNFDYGQLDYGAGYSNAGITLAANHLDATIDEDFVITDYHSTFFIAGDTITTFANIPAIQQQQFRQMILNLKPAHMVGFLFINYI